MVSISQRLATELNVQLNQVNATVALLNEGATVPFIARYRKEATGGLDDAQLPPRADSHNSARPPCFQGHTPHSHPVLVGVVVLCCLVLCVIACFLD